MGVCTREWKGMTALVLKAYPCTDSLRWNWGAWIGTDDDDDVYYYSVMWHTARWRNRLCARKDVARWPFLPPGTRRPILAQFPVFVIAHAVLNERSPGMTVNSARSAPLKIHFWGHNWRSHDTSVAHWRNEVGKAQNEK